MGFVGRLSQEIGRGVFLVHGKHKNKKLWHYVKVPQEKITEFKKAVQNGQLDVAHYGEILFSGWGDNPPDDITEKVENPKKFNSDADA